MIGFHTIDHISGQNMELNSMVPINCNLLHMCIVVCMNFVCSLTAQSIIKKRYSRIGNHKFRPPNPVDVEC